MTDTTPRLLLPFPEGSDAADGPLALQALAERLEEILADHADLWQPGDFKVSSRTASHGRWLLCDGTEKTQVQIETALGMDAGDAAAFVALWGTGAPSIYGAAAAGKVKLPDARNRAVAIAGPAGLLGLTQRARGAAFGVEDVTLSAAQSGVRDHSHEAGSLAVESHAHGDGSLAVASHHHGINFNTGGPSNTVLVQYQAGGSSFVAPQTTHVHLVSGDTDTQEPDVNGNTGTAAPDVNGSVNAVTTSHHASNGDAAETAHTNVQPSLALGSLFVRV